MLWKIVIKLIRWKKLTDIANVSTTYQKFLNFFVEIKSGTRLLSDCLYWVERGVILNQSCHSLPRSELISSPLARIGKHVGCLTSSNELASLKADKFTAWTIDARFGYLTLVSDPQSKQWNIAKIYEQYGWNIPSIWLRFKQTAMFLHEIRLI